MGKAFDFTSMREKVKHLKGRKERLQSHAKSLSPHDFTSLLNAPDPKPTNFLKLLQIEAIRQAVRQSARDDLNAAFKKAFVHFVDCISDERMGPAKILDSIKPGPNAAGTIAWVQNQYLDERENTIELVGANLSGPYMERLEVCLANIRKSAVPTVPEWASSAHTWFIWCKEAEYMNPILQRLRAAGVIQ